MKKVLTTLLILCIITTAKTQSISGAWFGRADAVMDGTHNNYLTELILKQKGNEVEGVFGYYFKNMYQSFFVRGTYNSKTRQVYIKQVPVIHFRAATSNEMDCPMEFEGTLVVSKAKSTLNGYFYRPAKYKYTCPDLRVTYTLDINDRSQDSLRQTVAMQKIWAPLPEDLVVVKGSNSDNSNNGITGIIIPEKNEAKVLVEKFEARKNNIQQEITVTGDSVRISFYDNGDIDGDSISVFVNGDPVLSKRELDVRGLNLYVKLDSAKKVNEVSMFAENLGKYPPNTALMVIFDGELRHEIYLSSSLTQNATVRIRRK